VAIIATRAGARWEVKETPFPGVPSDVVYSDGRFLAADALIGTLVEIGTDGTARGLGPMREG
jgi:hypothetical protein